MREVRFGKVVDEVLRYAESIQTQLIVMGTRARRGLAKIAFGSIAEKVMHSSKCPVVIVNAETPSTEGIASESDAIYASLKSSDSPALDLIARALSLRATDIHIDPIEDDNYQVRFRVDGLIAPYCVLDGRVADHLIQQYLTLAHIDQAEPFRPREGRLQLPSSMNQIEVRITTAPVAGGNAVALRLISKDRVFLSLDHLGFSNQELSTIQKMLHGNEGLILVTGPTGSGKTTTVYSMLESFGSKEHNIVSIEDPVEFSVPFVRQISVDDRHGLTMTSGLRTVLRMDPDIIFIGEIRDPEAAEIAVRAASSGRFVFSSLHTRDVASTITSLRDLGIPNHSIAGNVVGIVNQRLVRRLCRCRKEVAVSPELLSAFAEQSIDPPSVEYEPVGCETCRGSGYFDRCGVYETVLIEGAVAQAISEGASEYEIRHVLRSQGTYSISPTP